MRGERRWSVSTRLWSEMADKVFEPVVVAVFGVSTLYGHWGFYVAREIVEAISGQTLHLHIATLEQLRDGFAKREGGSVVVTGDMPDEDLARFVSNANIPLITFADDAADTARWAAKTRELPPEYAARFCSDMFCSLAPLLTAERALRFVGKQDESPERVVAAIIAYLWPNRADWLAPATFAHLVETGKIDKNVIVERSRYSIANSDAPPPSPKSLQTMCEAAECYSDLLLGNWPREIVWPFALFTRPDKRPWSRSDGSHRASAGLALRSVHASAGGRVDGEGRVRDRRRRCPASRRRRTCASTRSSSKALSPCRPRASIAYELSFRSTTRTIRSRSDCSPRRAPSRAGFCRAPCA